jgi:hypothetical protein
MKRPKICQHCNLYNAEEKKCKRMNIPVGNTNSCFSWRPAIRYIRTGKPVEFVEY